MRNKGFSSKRIDFDKKEIKVNKELVYSDLLLYHGSKGGIQGDVMPISRADCDFGPGFYMGTNRRQAYSFAYRVQHKCAKYYECHLDVSNLNIKELTGMQWAIFIAHCRGMLDEFENTVLYNSVLAYRNTLDVVYGDIADDSIFQAIGDFLDGLLTDIGLIKVLSALDFGKQYTLISEKACKNVRLREVFLMDSDIEDLTLYNKHVVEDGKRILSTVGPMFLGTGHAFLHYVQAGIFNKDFLKLPTSLEEMIHWR